MNEQMSVEGEAPTYAERVATFRGQAQGLFRVEDPDRRTDAFALGALILVGLEAIERGLTEDVGTAARALSRKLGKDHWPFGFVHVGRHARAQIAGYLRDCGARGIEPSPDALAEGAFWALWRLPDHETPGLPRAYDGAYEDGIAALAVVAQHVWRERAAPEAAEDLAERMLTKCARAVGCSRDLFHAEAAALNRSKVK